LAERVVLQDRDEPLLLRLVDGRAEDVAAEVVDVDDRHLGDAAEQRLQVGGDLARTLGPEHDGLVVRGDRAARGPVDRPCLVARDAVEVALAPEQLGHRRDGGGEEDPQRAALAEGHLHRLGHAQADAVGRPGDVLREEVGQLAGLDVLDEVRPALRDRDDLLGHEQQVAVTDETIGVLAHESVEVVARHHDPRADRDAGIRRALDGDGERLAVVRLAHSR
jgi:hypothetical protein